MPKHWWDREPTSAYPKPANDDVPDVNERISGTLAAVVLGVAVMIGIIVIVAR